MNKWIIGIVCVSVLSVAIKQLLPTQKYKGIDLIIALVMMVSIAYPLLSSISQIKQNGIDSIQYTDSSGELTLYGEFFLETVRESLEDELIEDIFKQSGIAPQNVDINLQIYDENMYIESITIYSRMSNISQALKTMIDEKYGCEKVELINI